MDSFCVLHAGSISADIRQTCTRHILLGTPRSLRLRSPHLTHTLYTLPHTLCTSLQTHCTTLSSCRFRSSYCTPSSSHITLLSFTFHTHISMSHLSPHSSLFTLHIHISHLEYQFAFHSRIAEKSVLLLCWASLTNLSISFGSFRAIQGSAKH